MTNAKEPPGLFASISPDEAVRRVALARNAIVGEMQKVVVGQEALIEQMLIALFARGHCLLTGMPGAARSLTVSTLAQILHQKHSHLQLTLDLKPEDLTGRQVTDVDPQSGKLVSRLVRGPIFAGMMLAEDIDRAAPSTQAALLHAMHCGETMLAGRRFELPQPFLVVATQNDVVYSDSHPLSDSQRDRFMMSAHVGYPSESDEREIVARNSRSSKEEPRVVLRTRDVLWIQDLVRQIPIAQHMIDYAVDLTRATRPGEAGGPDFVNTYIDWGAGTRAAEQLVLAAKARALVKGRHLVHAGDIRAVAPHVLRHRVIMSRQAEIKGVSADQLVAKVIEVVKERSYGEPDYEPPELIVVAPRPARPRSSDTPYATPYWPLPPHLAAQAQAAQAHAQAHAQAPQAGSETQVSQSRTVSGQSYPPQPPDVG